jgi:hypothetical protein
MDTAEGDVILKVTDEESLEQSGNDFKNIDDVTREPTNGALSRRAGHFVESVLDFNPDATEQIDLMDKHLTCAETIGSKARDTLKALEETLDTQSASLVALFTVPGSDRLLDLLSDLTRIAERMTPESRGLSTGFLDRLRECIPGVSTPLKQYFQDIEDLRPEAEKRLRTIGQTITRQQASAALIVQHMEELQELSRPLGRAIRLGQLIDQTLCEALVYEVPRDDPRERFITGSLLVHLRKRVWALHLQMALNRKHLITLELLIQNSRELVYGLNQTRDIMIDAFDRSADLCVRLTRRRIVMGPLAPDRAAPAHDGHRDMPVALSLETLGRDLGRIHACASALKTFLAAGAPIIQSAVGHLHQLRTSTDEAFSHPSSSELQKPVREPYDRA